MTSRPAETLAAVLGALVTAVVAVLASFGVTVPTAYVTASTAVVGLVAAAVTWYVARRQRDPAQPVASAPDGKVVAAE